MPTPGLTKQEQDFLDREIRRGKRWGKLTFAEVMDTLDRQHDALVAIRDDDAGDQAYGFKDVGPGLRPGLFLCWWKTPRSKGLGGGYSSGALLSGGGAGKKANAKPKSRAAASRTIPAMATRSPDAWKTSRQKKGCARAGFISVRYRTIWAAGRPQQARRRGLACWPACFSAQWRQPRPPCDHNGSAPPRWRRRPRG